MSEIVHGTQRRPLVAGRSLFDEADELGAVVPATCRRTGRCRECVVEVQRGGDQLSPPTPAEAFLRPSYRLACQALVERTGDDVEFRVLRRSLRILMPPEGEPLELDPAVTVEGDRVNRDGQEVGTIGASGRLLGLALDVGTTTVVLDLVDLRTGESIQAAAFENPQRFGGSDVISRIAYEAEQPGELRRAMRRALNHELGRLYGELRIDRHDVHEVVVVGNSTMRDLFFGLDVGPIGVRPFRSTVEREYRAGRRESTALARLAHELGVLVNPQARIYGAPLIASHVGADAAADLVATHMLDLAADPEAARGTPETATGPVMLIDIGTNTEVLIGDGQRFLAASCPAGPAFEGGLVRHAMAGSEGAIESVRLHEGRLDYRTIGDVPPEGICGSGLIDVLAVLRAAGLMTAGGAFRDGAGEIAIAPDQGIGISRRDVSHLAQAKAANSCGIRILARSFGARPADIRRLYLAGAFANAIDVEHAMAIGFLPPVDPARVVRVGNASVRGAKALLLSRRKRAVLERLVGRIEHVELEAEPDFFDLFVDGLRFEPLPADEPVRAGASRSPSEVSA